MEILEKILRLLDYRITKPENYGEFHLIAIAFFVVLTVLLCVFHKKDHPERVRKVVLIVAIIVTLLEIYKQINYSFTYENGIAFDYQWYAFPFQFCSLPMYVGLLAGFTKKGRVHEAAMSFLATFALFAGLCVMIYPGDCFSSTLGISIQTMVCHGTMVSVGVYLLYTGYIKVNHRMILKAIPVFAIALVLANIMNEAAYYSGLLERETFNMFYVSRHLASTLPVYSMVHSAVPFPLNMVIYICVFSLAAYVILLVAMLLKKLFSNKKSKKVAN